MSQIQKKNLDPSNRLIRSQIGGPSCSGEIDKIELLPRFIVFPHIHGTPREPL